MEKLALHLLHQQLDNFCCSILNTKEVECCFHGKELYFLIATALETGGLSHLFQFDSGISFLKKRCYLSDSEHNFDFSTSSSPNYTKGILLSTYNAFSLSHWNDFETLREHLCLSNLAKGVLSPPLAEDSKKHIHLCSELHISKSQIFVGKAFLEEFGEKKYTEIPRVCLGSVDLQKQLHISTTETKIETVLRKSTSLSLLRDIRETMAAKVNQSKSLTEAFEREVNNLMILVFHVRVWTTTLRTRLISSGKDCNEPGWDSFDYHPWGQGLFDPGGNVMT
ncbi:hypothetical protein R3W88_019714 [Solanum pinnatisectum]|uniref:Uncharacterized protein n=1 Tax=Solanum pinnatisectum TaxID=50273 RepID=A0AAV9KL22_9SOLN|nr:hypothetical protein R3W88_019714 [Solanum pinnatisectum]